MAKRLGPTPPPEPSPPTQFVAARTKGLQLINTLGANTLGSIIKIDSPEGFLAMDAKLAAIRNVRAQWKLALEPIAGPLNRAIQKQKEALAEAKKAALGVTQLDEEISSKLDALEQRAKQLMADYKINERRQLEEEEARVAREAQALRDEARRREVQAAAAKTPQLKARLEQQRAELENRADQVEEKKETLTPVKGASSVTRTQQKPIITDPIKFLQAVKVYEPVGGVYAFGHPPLMTTNRKGEPAPLVEIVSARLTELWREQPGVVESWPGVKIVDDITIANR